MVAKTNKLNFKCSIATAASWKQLCQRLKAATPHSAPRHTAAARGRPWGSRLVNPVTDPELLVEEILQSVVFQSGVGIGMCSGVCCALLTEMEKR